jgi:hypothetical protein
MLKAFDQNFLRAFKESLRDATDRVARNASAQRRPRRQLNDAHAYADDKDSVETNIFLQQREHRRTRGRKVLHPTLKNYTPLPIKAHQEKSRKEQALQMDLKSRIDRTARIDAERREREAIK